MEYRKLGATDLHLSVAGYGAAPLGNVYNKIDPADGMDAVHYAIEQGINYFDVSPYYGLTVAETRLGEALEGYRDKVLISTKCGRYGANEFDFSSARIMASIDESLARLRTDHVDLLLAHDVEFGDPRQIVEETVPALRRIQSQGKARYIGISGYPLNTLIEIAEKTPLDAILTYCHYNLMSNDLEQTLAPFAKQHNIGLVNASPLHMGILSGRGAPEWHPAPAEVREAGRQVVDLCRARGVDAAQVAMRFCFDNQDCASTLTGISSRREVEACLKSLSMAADEDLLRKIHETIGSMFNIAWPSGREASRA